MGKMDDTEDDARYPLNQYRPNQNSRSPFPSNHYSKIAIRGGMVSPQIDRGYTKEEVEDYFDAEKEELNRGDQAIDEEVEEEDEDDEEEYGGVASNCRSREEESSPDRREKRRKLDKFALGFEFAPRAAATPPIASSVVTSSKPPARNNPADWTEDSTFVLLDTWGVLYTKNGRKSLRSDEWMEVAKRVNETSRTTRTDGQCRNRIDTLKKKYKKEKARMDESLSTNSYWVYFKKMEELMGLPTPPPAPKQQLNLSYGVDSGENVYTNSRHYPTRLNGLDDVRDSPEGSGLVGDDSEDDESDGLPPRSTKRPRRGPDLASFRMLAESIKKFGEIYEKIESSKRQHMAELDKMRREFQRDLEVQKRQILQRAQEEFEKLRQEEDYEDRDGEEEEDEEAEDGDEDNNDNDEINDSAENASS